MNNIFKSIKLLALALALSIGISYVAAWTAPTATPPNGNVSAPLNVSANPQTKSGNLGASWLYAYSYRDAGDPTDTYFMKPNGDSKLKNILVAQDVCIFGTSTCLSTVTGTPGPQGLAGASPAGVYSAADQFVASSYSWTVISSLPVTTNGNAVIVAFSDWIHGTNSNVTTMLWRVARDGITVWDSISYSIGSPGESGGAPLPETSFYLDHMFMDTPTSGGHTYTLEVRVTTGGTSSLHGKRGIYVFKI